MTKPIFSIMRMLYSVASAIKEEYPDTPIYIDPKQQGIQTPCFFVQLVGSGEHLKREIGVMGSYHLTIDISYLTEYDVNDKYSDYYKVIEKLDVILCNIKYVNDEGERIGSFGVFSRDYTTDLSAMHYKIRTAVRVRLVDDENESALLRELIYTLTIKNGGKVHGRIKKQSKSANAT